MGVKFMGESDGFSSLIGGNANKRGIWSRIVEND
jgi:hypothetical protein